jgi:RNA polymerase sigma factor (sigma-70 family)
MAEQSALPAPLSSPLRLLTRNEAKLARLATAGDERAFAAIYERYHQELYRYCRAMLGNAADAQDALQNTMASAIRSLPGETRRIELRPWLYRVARNESITLRRGRRTVAEADEALLPSQPAADTTFESRERLRTLVADLGSLPERQRSALVMRELSGMSHEQIALALSISPGAARQVVYEARLALLELEEGRSMECERVRLAISDHDGRVLRGRKLRAHLRGCERCSDFRAAIEARRSDLELIAPPLSAVAASGVIAGLLGGGGGSAAGGAVGGLVAGGASGSVATAKVLGVVAASAAIGIGAGSVSGVELPGLGGDDASPASRAPAAAEETPATPGADHSSVSTSPGGARDASPASGKQDASSDPHTGKGNANSHAKDPGATSQDQANAYGQAEGIPEQANGNAHGQDQGGGNAYGHTKHDAALSEPVTPRPGQSETKTTGPPEHSSFGGSSTLKPEKVEKTEKSAK